MSLYRLYGVIQADREYEAVQFCNINTVFSAKISTVASMWARISQNGTQRGGNVAFLSQIRLLCLPKAWETPHEQYQCPSGGILSLCETPETVTWTRKYPQENKDKVVSRKSGWNFNVRWTILLIYVSTLLEQAPTRLVALAATAWRTGAGGGAAGPQDTGREAHASAERSKQNRGTQKYQSYELCHVRWRG